MVQLLVESIEREARPMLMSLSGYAFRASRKTAYILSSVLLTYVIIALL